MRVSSRHPAHPGGPGPGAALSSEPYILWVLPFSVHENVGELHCLGENPASVSLETCSGTQVGVAEEGVPPTSLREHPTPTPRYPPPSPPRPLLWLNLAEIRPNFTRSHIITVPWRRLPSLRETGPRRGLGGLQAPPQGQGSCGEHNAKPLPPLLPSRPGPQPGAHPAGLLSLTPELAFMFLGSPGSRVSVLGAWEKTDFHNKGKLGVQRDAAVPGAEPVEGIKEPPQAGLEPQGRWGRLLTHLGAHFGVTAGSQSPSA